MPRPNLTLLAFTAAPLFLFAAHAHATIYNFTANLDPFQEVPPHNTPGYGYADLTLDDSTGNITISNGSYTDLLAGATAVSINDAAVGVNGPILATLTLDTPGNTSGTFSGTATLTAPQIADAIAGNTYINIRDSVFPSGEIRGQIETPEPASLSLLAISALPLLSRRRRTN